MSLIRSTSVVSGLTFVSRITGFLRDMVFARFFGATASMDVFIVAFQIPNFLRRLFGEGAFSQAFVPVFSEYRTTKSEGEVRELADHVSGTFGLILAVVTAIGVVAAPVLILVFALGFKLKSDPADYELAVDLVRITFAYIFFISLTALAGGILNTYRRFGPPAFTPVLLNLVLIGSAFYLAPMFDEPIFGLAWGVFIAGAVQLLFQLPFLRSVRMLPRPRIGFKDPGVRKIFKLMLPAIFGTSVAQINLIIDRVIASFLVTGSISWLYYSDRLMEFPLGVFAIALATVILPGLSEKHAQKTPREFSAMLDWALKIACVIAVPAAVALFILAEPLLAAFFEYGAFSMRDTRMAAYSLQAYALGLLALTLIKVLAPGFYARQDTKTPVKIAVVALVSNIVLNVLLVGGFTYTGILPAHTGLALATSLSAVINAALLYRGLRRVNVYSPGTGWGAIITRTILANVVMAIALVALLGSFDDFSTMRATGRAGHVGLLVAAGAGAYFATLFLAGMRPRHLKGKLVP